MVVDHVDDARAEAGLPALPGSDYLHAAGFARLAAACGSGGPSPVDPMVVYGGEPAVAIVERVGVATIDPELAPEVQDVVATEQVWAQWRDDPAITDPRWDDMTVAQYECIGIRGGESDLYMALVLRDRP